MCICKTSLLQKRGRSELAPNKAVVLAALCISSCIHPVVGSRDRGEGERGGPQASRREAETEPRPRGAPARSGRHFSWPLARSSGRGCRRRRRGAEEVVRIDVEAGEGERGRSQAKAEQE
jgi:hypothetical protein